ncbi:hypothetical protein BDA99DRAFT_115835 [Phascolomyces articulosus]|uniref:Uncharacterized protein n=1 Tax=Phascolomyces articulosus TaxID=60185 RepID=A0AAD5KMT1_9FUNG|nr:hypothetical protein BDA99DRAFT_115835 [Phascolomyces articulosus]
MINFFILIPLSIVTQVSRITLSCIHIIFSKTLYIPTYLYLYKIIAHPLYTLAYIFIFNQLLHTNNYILYK